MKCLNCGWENQEGSQLCANCGSALNQTVPQQVMVIQRPEGFGLTLTALVLGSIGAFFKVVLCIFSFYSLLGNILGVIGLMLCPHIFNKIFFTKEKLTYPEYMALFLCSVTVLMLIFSCAAGGSSSSFSLFGR